MVLQPIGMINAEGKTRHDYGREKFTEKIWEWKEQSGNTITQQLRRMGASLDWSRERFTMDEGLSTAVTEVFVRLYEEGLIYRGKRLVNWDPVLHTAISDLEVIATEEPPPSFAEGWKPLSTSPAKETLPTSERSGAMNSLASRAFRYSSGNLRLARVRRERSRSSHSSRV